MSELKINKLILLGSSYKRTLYFKGGLNVIRGDRTSGKSLVLSLIDYCMGRSQKISLNVQKELDEHCDQVFLEIRIGDELFTLNRSLKQKISNIGIYFCKFDDISGYIPKISSIKEVMHFIMSKLNINEYHRTKFKPHSNEQELETISFRDIFRYVYVKQHALGTDNFLDHNSPFIRNKNPYAFEMLFNLVEADKDHLNAQLVNAKNNIEARRREITGLNSYLEDKDATDFMLLTNEANKIREKIKNQKLQKDLIIKGNKSTDKETNENSMYIKIKNRMTEITNEIFEYEKEKSELNYSISSKMFLLEEYKKEKSETSITMEINYRLVVQDHKIECPLCHSTVNSHINQESKIPQTQNVLNKIQREINAKMKLVNSLIEKDEIKIEQINSQIDSLKEEHKILNVALDEFTKNTSVPFLSQIDSINSGSMSRNWTLEMVNFLNSYRAPLASLSVKIRGKNAPSFNREASTFFYKAILP